MYFLSKIVMCQKWLLFQHILALVIFIYIAIEQVSKI